MANHTHLAGSRIVEIIRDELLPELVTEENLASGDVPEVRLAKRITQMARQSDTVRIRDGITVAPRHTSMEGGTNQRDDTAYRFYVSIGFGTTTDEIEADWPLAVIEQAVRNRFTQTRINITGLQNACELATTIARTSEFPDSDKLEEQIDATVYQISVWLREARRRYV